MNSKQNYMKMDEIIMRILTKTNSYDDIVEFAQWLNADEKNREEFQKIESYWNANLQYDYPMTAENSFKKLQQKIAKLDMRNSRRKRMVVYSGVAASLLIILTLSFFMMIENTPRISQQYIYMTGNSISTFFMEDSTRIILNRNSKVSYTDDYGQKERRVRLIGEAYFDVKKNTVSPFIVDMDGTIVKVLGTKFTASNKEETGTIETVLLEGAIRFVSSEQSVLMKPNQKLLFNKNNRNLELTEIDSEQESAWKEGLFKYRSLSFERLMKKLEADYGVKIIINNKKLLNPELKFTGSFEQNIAFHNVLDVINRTIHIKWKEENGIYYIY